jgi:hypothetical protein
VCRELGFRPEIDFAPSAKNAPFAGFLKSLADGLSTSYRRKVV